MSGASYGAVSGASPGIVSGASYGAASGASPGIVSGASYGVVSGASYSTLIKLGGFWPIGEFTEKKACGEILVCFPGSHAGERDEYVKLVARQP